MLGEFHKKPKYKKAKKVSSELVPLVASQKNMKTCSMYWFYKAPDPFETGIIEGLSFIFPAKLQFGPSSQVPKENNLGHLSIYNSKYRVVSRELDFTSGTLRCNMVYLYDPSELKQPPEQEDRMRKETAHPEMTEILSYVKVLAGILRQVHFS